VPVGLLRDWIEQFVRDERELHSQPFFDIDRVDQQASRSVGSSLSPVAAGKKASAEAFKRWDAAGANEKDKHPERAGGGGTIHGEEVQTSREWPREWQGSDTKQSKGARVGLVHFARVCVRSAYIKTHPGNDRGMLAYLDVT